MHRNMPEWHKYPRLNPQKERYFKMLGTVQNSEAQSSEKNYSGLNAFFMLSC